MAVSPDTVAKLWKYQFGPWEKDQYGFPKRFHPYTCGNRDPNTHTEFGGDLGMLVPTINGWICPCCDYTQPFNGFESKMIKVTE